MSELRVGVVGCGGIGTAHASGLVGLPNVRLAAGCDVFPQTLQSFKDRWKETWNNIALYADHQEMLAKERLDIVTVATSDHRHTDIVVNAANAGVKGIFCEKPLATNLKDADRMLEATESNGTVLSVDHTRRWQPLWRRAKEGVVDKGEIGSVQYVIGTLNGGRAMLFRNGTHLLDTICWFADSEPEWVFAELEAGYEHYSEYRGDGGHDPKTEPSAHGYIHFANGVRGYYSGGPKTTPGKFRAEIVGETGIIRINDQKGEVLKGESVEPIEPPLSPVTGIAAGVQEVVRILTEGGTPASTGQDALRVVELLMGFLESQRRGNAKVTIPLPRD